MPLTATVLLEDKTCFLKGAGMYRTEAVVDIDEIRLVAGTIASTSESWPTLRVRLWRHLFYEMRQSGPLSMAYLEKSHGKTELQLVTVELPLVVENGKHQWGDHLLEELGLRPSSNVVIVQSFWAQRMPEWRLALHVRAHPELLESRVWLLECDESAFGDFQRLLQVLEIREAEEADLADTDVE